MKKDSRIEKIVVPVVVCILSVSDFILCAYLVFSGITTSWDTSTFLAINDFLPNSPLSVLMIYLSEYGREVVFTSVFFILAFSRKASHRRAAFYMLLTFIALVILGPLVQASLFRVRPYVTLKDVGKFLLPPINLSSFPSGHSYGVAGLTAVLWYTLRNEKKFLYVLTLEAALVCISRIYVGAHYPMDVIGGVLFGVAIASGIAAFQIKLDNVFRRLDVYWRARLIRYVEPTGRKIDE
jgi:membrane-associated phospholipid phosphatase